MTLGAALGLLVVFAGFLSALAAFASWLAAVLRDLRRDRQPEPVSPWWIVAEHVHGLDDILIMHGVTEIADRHKWGQG